MLYIIYCNKKDIECVVYFESLTIWRTAAVSMFSFEDYRIAILRLY